MHQPIIAIDHSHLAAESTHGLGQLYSDIAAADHEKMCGDFLQFECFDVCKGLRLNKARNWFEHSACPGVDDHMGSSELTRGSVRQCGLQSLGANEASGAEDEFRAARLVVVEIHVIPARYHRAFAFAHSAHVDGKVSFGDTELFTSAKVRSNLRTVQDVLAGQTGDVRARPADVLALDHRDTLPLLGKSPRRDG